MKGAKTHHFDYVLAITVALLLLFGILILASVSAVSSQEKIGKTGYFFFHQLEFGILPGIIFGFIALRLSLSFFKKIALGIILLNLVLMGLVFLPQIGITAGGASRWLNLGLFSFQPSEFLKFTFILYLAVWLANRTEKNEHFLKSDKKDWRFTLFSFLVIIAIITLLLVFQSDVSTLVIIILVALLMYFLAKTPLWHSALMLLLIIAAIGLLIVFEPYRMERLLVFLHIKEDPMGVGYQIKQALIAIGSGKIFGLSLGMSHQKFGFIPQTMSDSIFSIIGEEMGFAGSFVLVTLFLFFLWRGLKIAKKSNNHFSRLLAAGITCWICLQGFINIGSMLGILPLMGVPLPFVSYGGSHLVNELIGVGLLLNISKSG